MTITQANIGRDARDVALLVLGAGAGTRYGTADKLDAVLGTQKVAHHVLQMLASFDWGQKILTCRMQQGWSDAYQQQGFELVQLADSKAGMLGSLHQGVQAVRNAQNVLICLADMPLIPAAHLENLLRAFQTSTAPIVASRSHHYQGPPAICRADYLRALPRHGEGGARSLLPRAEFVMLDALAVHDIDTVADLSAAQQILQGRSQ